MEVVFENYLVDFARVLNGVLLDGKTYKINSPLAEHSLSITNIHRESMTIREIDIHTIL